MQCGGLGVSSSRIRPELLNSINSADLDGKRTPLITQGLIEAYLAAPEAGAKMSVLLSIHVSNTWNCRKRATEFV